jgi:cytochrome o ubiquinol oxidase subunit 2
MNKKFQSLALSGLMLGLTAILSGCKEAILLHPQGMLGKDEKELVFTALNLMLVVVIPVIILTLVFAWRYRASNTKATYDPNFTHSNKIEVVVWGIPIVIVVILAVITWKSTHELDPYRPIEIPGVKPLTVQVVALDWKWMFIYPEQKVATINYLQLPVGVPVDFKVTADAPMNSFMIPQLGGQIYAMGGMQTHLHLVADAPGVYEGRGYSFSGAGFNGMVFKTHVGSEAEFTSWVQAVKAKYPELNVAKYKELVKPSEYQMPQFFGSVTENLYDNIIMKFMMPGMEDMQGMGNASMTMAH